VLLGAGQNAEIASLQYEEGAAAQHDAATFLSRPETGSVEVALAQALRAATAAGQWSVVAQLAAELAARRTTGAL
jgi:hypothetical protein